MSEVILLVGHGSREPSGNREVEDFAARWRARHPEWDIELCFIEFADVLLDGGLERSARRAGRVVVVPLILNAAGHVKMEIPEHIEAARARFPATGFVYARHLSGCDAVLAILKRRLHAAMRALDVPDPKTTGVILLGRGSSDRLANGDVAKMARWLLEETEHELVDLAFTGITHPQLERVVQRQARLGMTQIAVLPYYLFTGTLVERIKRQVGHLSVPYPRIRFALADHFGFEEEIFELVDERVREALGRDPGSMGSDDSKPRRWVAEPGAHHGATD